jgi:dihydroorotate dehydrogenase (NAD+) catalytic subunit
VTVSPQYGRLPANVENAMASDDRPAPGRRTALDPAAVDLAVEAGPLRFRNPILAASGTYGYGEHFAEVVPPRALGGIVTKSVSPEPRKGNPPPRIAETPSGMLNSIGLENKGLDHFLRETLPGLRALDTVKIVSIVGRNVQDFVTCAEAIDAAGGIDAFELNMSCPNVKEGGIEFSTAPPLAERLVAAVRKVTRRPLFAKLSPNVTDVKAVARAAVDGGADGLALINTLRGVAIDWRRRKPVLGGITGGLSGPAVKPVALYMVWEVATALPRTPVIGIGGAMTAEDVLEFLAVGARAVQIGTAHFADPSLPLRLDRELRETLAREGIARARDVVGTIPRTGPPPPAPCAG